MTRGGYLIYHPKRVVSWVDGKTVYHDSFSGNQDPYVWSRRFLHTACHMTQMSPQIGDINFWVSGDAFPAFTQLWCDLVFGVQDQVLWTEPNHISPEDPLVESAEAFVDHYAPMPTEHLYRQRQRFRVKVDPERFTLKADPDRSFQPQRQDGTLIDIVPYLKATGLSLDGLRIALRAGFGSRPLRLAQETALTLYETLVRTAPVRLSGAELEAVRRSDHWPPGRRPS